VRSRRHRERLGLLSLVVALGARHGLVLLIPFRELLSILWHQSFSLDSFPPDVVFAVASFASEAGILTHLVARLALQVLCLNHLTARLMLELIVLAQEGVAEGAGEDAPAVVPHAALALYAYRILIN